MPEIYEGNTGVYCIRNVKNGKRYVGSTVMEFKKRWACHRSSLKNKVHKNGHLMRAWKKYGTGAFVFQILERCPPENCLEREQYWIDYYDAANGQVGYNLSPTAGSNLGTVRSQDSRERSSDALKMTFISPERRRRHKVMCDQRSLDPEWRRKNAENNRRMAQDPEYRRKMEEVNKRTAADPEWRRKVAEGNRLRASDPEWNRRNAEKNRLMASDPDWIRAHAEGAARRRGRPFSEEHRRKLREASARRWARYKAEHGDST
jgi:group I intron endonuclease